MFDVLADLPADREIMLKACPGILKDAAQWNDEVTILHTGELAPCR